ncbi:DUF1534 domain-containing protein [Pseudomonas syringae]|nr:DUF1534 domain-containing protein [Pseudomonas syringae]MCF5491734.1 DUF1534 domain-containing protein [Pseudomonas syringae]MCF5501800.1 DUF1534 domain-containing protein [Pseudomonas syringae]MCF5525031.1 DUF1534 domain-containing protein [Pseudomonas syringae]MCF5534323.1 DUF1534 domain-containing protein [Pseudomonas syringae]
MGLSFPTLQRGNALRDALRHRRAPRCMPEVIVVINTRFSARVARIFQLYPENRSCSITCGSFSPRCSRYSAAMPSGCGCAKARAPCG